MDHPGAGGNVRLVALAPEHAEAILAGQDAALAREIVGRVWDAGSVAEFCTRAARWAEHGPVRELAALDARGTLVGGGGVHRVGAGIERGQVALTYWVLRAYRGVGLGTAIAGALVREARADGRSHVAVLRIAPGNSASRAVARSLGARPSGTSERHPADATRTVQRWVLPLRPG